MSIYSVSANHPIMLVRDYSTEATQCMDMIDEINALQEIIPCFVDNPKTIWEPFRNFAIMCMIFAQEFKTRAELTVDAKKLCTDARLSLPRLEFAREEAQTLAYLLKYAETVTLHTEADSKHELRLYYSFFNPPE